VFTTSHNSSGKKILATAVFKRLFLLQVDICTMAIFASSSQHAAVNFGQMEIYQFVPNAPLGMVEQVHKKGEVVYRFCVYG